MLRVSSPPPFMSHTPGSQVASIPRRSFQDTSLHPSQPRFGGNGIQDGFQKIGQAITKGISTVFAIVVGWVLLLGFQKNVDEIAKKYPSQNS